MVNLASTTRHDFHQANPKEAKLFSVCAGVPASDALRAASCFMGVAMSLCNGVGCLDEDDMRPGMACDLRDMAHAARYLLEMAQAVVDSIEVPK
jgi:hypothetical protein